MNAHRARVLSLLLLAVSTVAALVAFLYGPKLVQPEPTDTDSYADGPLGYEAMKKTLEDLDVHVFVDRVGESKDAGAPVILFEPEDRVMFRNTRWRVESFLRARALEGRDTILVLPKWSLEMQTDEDGEERQVVVRPDKWEVQRLLSDATYFGEIEREDIDIPETAMLREWTVKGRYGPRRIVLQERQTISLDDFWFDNEDASRRPEVLLGSKKAALVLEVHPSGYEGRVIVVSDPDLFHNFNMQRGDHSVVLADILRRLDTDTVVIDEVFHGHGIELTIGLILGEWPTVLLIIHGFGLAVLFAWAGLRRFGPPQRLAEAGQGGSLALVELTARVLASGRRPSGLARRYVLRVIEDTADRLHVPPSRVLAPRAQAIDRIAERRGIEGGAVDIVEHMRRHPPRNNREALASAHRVFLLRRRVLTRRTSRSEQDNDRETS